MARITTAAYETLKADTQLMGIVEDNIKKKKASHEGGNSDKFSKRSLMNSSGRKINSDDIVDKSSRRGKNDPIQIIQPRNEPTSEKKRESEKSKYPELPPKEPSEKPKTD